MNVSDLMTTSVVTVRANASITEAIGLMLEKGISGLPVVDAAGALVGIVTEGDFLRRGELGTERHRPRWLELLLGPHRLADEYVHTHARKVEDIMTRDVAAVTEDTPLDAVVRTMEKRRVKRLPVVRGGKIVGIISRANLVHALARLAIPSVPVLARSLADDNRIRGLILAEMDRQPWAPRATVDVSVQDGVAELRGTVIDEKDRQAMRVLVEGVPGVTRIEDNLQYIPPIPTTLI